MHFDFTEDQQEIKRTAHDLLAARSGWDALRRAVDGGARDDALWAELCSLGWPGIAIAEEHGGQGLGVVELAVLIEELGYVCAVSPLLSSAMAGLAIQDGGSEAQRARWLPGLASGQLKGALGAAGLVPDAGAADVIVLVDGDGGASLLARTDAQVVGVQTVDPTRPYASVSGSGEPLDGARASDLAAVALSAELVGLSQRALDMTLAYVKDRKQFGVPVGSFQAVQHRCSAMLLATEAARSVTYYAAWAADADRGRLAEASSLAKAAASSGGREATASAIQAHGGIGFTWEADVHWLYKRAQMDAALLGGAGTHHRRLIGLLAARAAG